MTQPKSLKKIYLVFINVGGGLHPIITLRKETDWETGWWDKTGNYGEWKNPYKLGWRESDGYYKFATTSLKEAKLVWSGAEKFRKIIKRLT